jgi:hypothetical protein
MGDIGWVGTVALLLLVAVGWVLHLKAAEPAELVLFGAIVLGLFLASLGFATWVPWLWYGTLAAALAFYGTRWKREAGPESSRPTGRHRQSRD